MTVCWSRRVCRWQFLWPGSPFLERGDFLPCCYIIARPGRSNMTCFELGEWDRDGLFSLFVFSCMFMVVVVGYRMTKELIRLLVQATFFHEHPLALRSPGRSGWLRTYPGLPGLLWTCIRGAGRWEAGTALCGPPARMIGTTGAVMKARVCILPPEPLQKLRSQAIIDVEEPCGSLRCR
jgi:hypothetical protein